MDAQRTGTFFAFWSSTAKSWQTLYRPTPFGRYLGSIPIMKPPLVRERSSISKYLFTVSEALPLAFLPDHLRTHTPNP